MKAADIMVTNVITAHCDESVQDVAELLLAHRISAVPVLNSAGDLVGIVSEGDLMRRAEIDTQHRHSWWLRLLLGREGLAGEFIREHARKVGDVMTKHVITAPPDTPIGDIAELLETKGIKRVPIVNNGRIVGIVSRANLLQALASWLPKQIAGAPVTDTALRETVLKRLKEEAWTRTSLINVIVDDGNVSLWGVVDSNTEKTALRVAAEITPGVRAVNDAVIIRPFDTD